MTPGYNFKPISRWTDLRIKLTVIIPVCAVVVACAWLFKWIGMHPSTLFIMAAATAHVSSRYLLVPAAERIAPSRPGFLRDAQVEARFGRFAILIGIASVWGVEYFAARELHLPHPGTGDDPLFLQA